MWFAVSPKRLQGEDQVLMDMGSNSQEELNICATEAVSLPNVKRLSRLLMVICMVGAGLIVHLGIVWLVGRFGFSTYFFARTLGMAFSLVSGLCGMASLRGYRAHQIFGCAIFGISLIVQIMWTELVFPVFMSGVVSAVESASNMENWEELPSELGASEQTEASKLIVEKQIPEFVKNMYPHRQVWCSLTGTPSKQGTALVVWWRDVQFSFGVSIGHQYSKSSSTFFSKQVTPRVHVVAFK